MTTLLEAGQVEKLQRRKRLSVICLLASTVLLAAAVALRFVPRWNDRLAGRPQYTRAMTTLTTQEFAKAAQDRFPEILLGEDDRCEALKPTGITDDQVAGCCGTGPRAWKDFNRPPGIGSSRLPVVRCRCGHYFSFPSLCGARVSPAEILREQ